jgi:hypothetical protein
VHWSEASSHSRELAWPKTRIAGVAYEFGAVESWGLVEAYHHRLQEVNCPFMGRQRWACKGQDTQGHSTGSKVAWAGVLALGFYAQTGCYKGECFAFSVDEWVPTKFSKDTFNYKGANLLGRVCQWVLATELRGVEHCTINNCKCWNGFVFRGWRDCSPF